jgi:hypothetical protein
MQIEPNSVVQRTGDLLFSQLDDDKIAIDSQAGYYYAMNESAGRVWELIAEPISVDAVCAQLHAEYDVAPQQCRQDVLALLAALYKAGLVEVRA